MTRSVLVIDVGTSSVKAVLFNQNGHIQRECERSYRTITAGPGMFEQEPNDWWNAAVDAAFELGNLDTVELVALSGTMQSVIPMDAQGNAIRPAILYSDGRAIEEYSELSKAFDQCAASKITGNPPNEFMSAFKIAWLQRHEPSCFANTRMFHSGAKDYPSR